VRTKESLFLLLLPSFLADAHAAMMMLHHRRPMIVGEIRYAV